MTRQESEDFVKKMFEPTIDNAIRDMRTSKKFFLTEDGKFYSIVAKEYIKDKEKFLPFIKEEKRKEFISEYAQVLQEVGDVADTDWNAVDELLHLQGHSGGTMSCLISKVLYFSPYGLDFIEHICGVEERIKTEKKIASKKTSTPKSLM